MTALAWVHPAVDAVLAGTEPGNVASQKVLAKAGFVPVGPATPADLGGKSGTWYQRELTVEPNPDE